LLPSGKLAFEIDAAEFHGILQNGTVLAQQRAHAARAGAMQADRETFYPDGLGCGPPYDAAVRIGHGIIDSGTCAPLWASASAAGRTMTGL
jgi:hypothetical protein